MTDMIERLGAVLGPGYRVERELGGGGMSLVFLAYDTALERRVVVKLHPHGARGLSGDRFRREIQLAAQLQHPNLVPVLTAGEADGLLYFVMPFVEGESLRTLLEGGRAVEPGRARVILRDVARALAFAHQAGVVHRDIKPENILLSGDAAMVTDFGVAKALTSARDPSARLTGAGFSLGTPAYIAPEQAAGGDDVDHRADLYAWGCVAYELLAGAPPFADRPAQQLIVAHLTERPVPLAEKAPGVPSGLAELVMRCLEKDPGRRPASARELVDGLEGSASPSPGPARTSVGRWVAVAAAVVVLALGYLRFGPSDARADTRSIAVLPLAAVGGDDDYVADGLTDELIAVLSRVPGLRVASRTSVYALKPETGLDVREIARRLEVGAVLEGSVRKAAGQLRLTAQLTSAADGLTIWSDTYQRDAGDLFQVQDELARAVASALEVQLEIETANARGTDDLGAYDLYLKGRHRWYQRGGPALREAVAHFEQAIARDSSFARAWAGLGDALALLPLYTGTPMDSVAAARARAAAARAVASTLRSPRRTPPGSLAKGEGGWAAATASLERAIAADSANAVALQWLGEVQYLTGDLEGAVATFERASRVDSASAVIAAQLGHVYGLVGRDSAAIRAVERAARLAPELGVVHLFTGSVHLSAGRLADAATAFERAAAVSELTAPANGLACYALTRAGRTVGAARVCGAIDRSSGTSFALALKALAAGDRPGALSWLERSIDEREPFLYSSSLTAPWWRELQSDSGFLAQAARMGVSVASPGNGAR
ncbi:MAG: protein kinase [Gemmatimonadales bacterium]